MRVNRRIVAVAVLTLAPVIGGSGVLAQQTATAIESNQVVALANYELLTLEEQTVHRAGGGAVVLRGDDTIVGLYSRSRFSRDRVFDHPAVYDAVDLVYDGRSDRRQVLLMFKSESDRPVAGGWATFQAASVFGYEVVARPRVSLVVGAGLALGDFGIELEPGTVWPLIPVPFARATFQSRLVSASFDFITGPNLNLTLAPERPTQLSADLRIDQYRDARDLIFEVAVSHRFVAVGLKNDTLGFVPGNPDRRSDETSPVEVHYLAAFGTLDFGILQLNGGYAFAGRQRYGESATAGWGDGSFVSIQAMLPF